jgi:hypothetical protein
VVNPLGVAEPTVGETSTPLSSCLTPGVISDKCFDSGILKYIYVYSDNYAHRL